jgi:hypothetical protein
MEMAYQNQRKPQKKSIMKSQLDNSKLQEVKSA